MHGPPSDLAKFKRSMSGAVRRSLEDREREDTLDPGDDAEEKATLIFNATGWTYRHIRLGHSREPDGARVEGVGPLVTRVRK